MPQTWTDEQLRDAVASQPNMFQTLIALGLKPRGGNYDTIRRRIAVLGIDTSHWPQRTAYRQASREEIIAAAAMATSVANAVRLLGWPHGTGARQRFLRAVTAHGVSIEHFSGRPWNRGKRLPPRGRPLSYYLVKGDRQLISSDRLRNLLVREGALVARCAHCELVEWQGEPVPLELDHINGDRYDNRPENLQLLCPNCHALTPTYRGRNIGRYRDPPPRLESPPYSKRPESGPLKGLCCRFESDRGHCSPCSAASVVA